MKKPFDDIEQISMAKSHKKSHKNLLKELKKEKHGKVDQLFRQAHEEVFECTDCMDCGNCCRTTGPMYTQKDIERVAHHLKLKPGAFIEKYLRFDEDNFWVLQVVPCPFLAEDNGCSIYEARPKACQEYPHTDMRHQKGIFDLTLKNAEVCPAVFNILENIKAATNKK